MSRQRLQRLAIAWAVTLADMEIPQEEIPQQSPAANPQQPDVSELDKSLARDRALRKYASPNTSGLTAEVSPEKTAFTFDLK